MAEFRQRATAYKLKIGDVLRGKPIVENERLNFIELGDKQLTRVNIVANVIDKYETEGSINEAGEQKKAYLSLTIDDASGQIRIKAFGDDVSNYKEIGQGDTVLIMGLLRYYNNEIYIAPEVIKSLDPRYLLVRKLELEKSSPVPQVTKEQAFAIKDQIIEMIKKSEDDRGLDIEKIILELKAEPDIINQEVKKLLEEGLAYEPRPGRIRYLG